MKVKVEDKTYEMVPLQQMKLEYTETENDHFYLNTNFVHSFKGNTDIEKDLFSEVVSTYWNTDEVSFTLNEEIEVTIKKSAYDEFHFDVCYEFEDLKVHGLIIAKDMKDAFKVFIDFHRIKADWVLEIE